MQRLQSKKKSLFIKSPCVYIKCIKSCVLLLLAVEWKIKAEATTNFLPEEEHLLLGKESKEEHSSAKLRIHHARLVYQTVTVTNLKYHSSGYAKLGQGIRRKKKLSSLVSVKKRGRISLVRVCLFTYVTCSTIRFFV